MAANFALDYYLHAYIPRRAPKPRVVYSADHYFITDNLASHDILIRNEGDAPAKGVKLYLAFLPRFKITNIDASFPPDSIINGVGCSSAELRWGRILPGQVVLARVVSGADKKEPQTVFTVELKLWYERGVVSAYEAKCIQKLE